MSTSQVIKHKTDTFLSDRRYYTIVFTLIAAGFAFMVGLSGYQSFWSDELFSVGVVSSRVPLGEMAKLFLTEETCNLPLYTVFLRFWYRLVPHTEQWLLLPSVLAYCAAVFFCGQMQRRYFGNMGGLVTVVLGLASSVGMYNAAWELRCYAFLILLIALFLFFNQRIYEYNRLRDSIFLGVTICMACYTHFFAMLVIGLWFLTELIHRCRNRKLSFRWMLPYFIGGGCFLPWAVLILINNTRNLSVFWASSPVPDSIGALISFLVSDAEGVRLALIAGMVLSALLYFLGQKKNEHFFYFANAIVIVCAIALIYAYSAWINPKGSLWVHRYFLSLIPSVFLLAGFLISSLIESIPLSDHLEVSGAVKTSIIIGSGILLLCYSGSKAKTNMKSVLEPYRETSSRILEEDPEHTSVLFYPARFGSSYIYYYAALGWQEFYFRDEIQVCPSLEEVQEMLPEKLYVSYQHIVLDNEVLAFLAENYTEVSRDTTLKLLEYKKGAGAPRLVSAETESGGVTVRWEPLPDAVNYRVFCKTAEDKWKIAGDTTDTCFTVTGLENGVTYWFTVRAISEDGKEYTSSYNPEGLPCEFVT